MGGLLSAIDGIEEGIHLVARADLGVVVIIRQANMRADIRDGDALRARDGVIRIYDYVVAVVPLGTPLESPSGQAVGAPRAIQMAVAQLAAIDGHALLPEQHGEIGAPIDVDRPARHIAPDSVAAVPGDFGTIAVEAALFVCLRLVNVFAGITQGIIWKGVEIESIARSNSAYRTPAASVPVPLRPKRPIPNCLPTVKSRMSCFSLDEPMTSEKLARDAIEQ